MCPATYHVTLRLLVEMLGLFEVALSRNLLLVPVLVIVSYAREIFRDSINLKREIKNAAHA